MGKWAQSTVRKLSYEGHMADAWAFRGDEGRGKLRKAMTSRKQAMTHGYPNGATRQEKSCHPKGSETWRTETSK